MSHRTIAALILLAVAGNAGAQFAGEPVGRLFLSPEKRELLDRQRALNALEAQAANEEPQILINGQVRRSSGKRTTWINGQAQNDAEAKTGVVALPDPQSVGSVQIESGNDPKKTVRVGETLDRGTRETIDPLGGGTITINRRR